MNKTVKNVVIVGLSAYLNGCSDEALTASEVYITQVKPTSVIAPVSQVVDVNSSSYICKIKGFQTGKKVKDPVERTFTQGDITHVQGHYPNEVQDGVLSVFFSTNSWQLMSGDIDDLRKFGRTLDLGSSLIIEGRADYRGTEERNVVLGKNRAQGIATFLGAYTHGSVDYVSYGENDASQDTRDRIALQRDRVVRIVPNKGLVSRALDVSPADVYLIDQSGSMQGQKWGQVQAFSFPGNAEVFTFESPKQDCSVSLSKRSPGGGTPLYTSLYDVLSSMTHSQTLTVLTDGDDTDGGKTPAQIIALAHINHIKINVIGLGVNQPGVLEQIASETGGQAYIRQ